MTPQRTDRYGFTKRFGVWVLCERCLPAFSLGVHLDWHTPTLDLHIGRCTVRLGRNLTQEERGRFVFQTYEAEGHTVGCLCERAQQEEE